MKSANDLFTPAKLSFFSFIALIKYQTDDPMVPYLYNDLLNIIKKIVNLIVKPDIMINWIHDADLINVNLSIKSNFIKPKDMNVGFSTVAAIVDLRKKDLVTKKKNC